MVGRSGRLGRLARLARMAAAVAPWVVASSLVTGMLSGPLTSQVLPFQTLVPAPPPPQSPPERKTPPVVQFEPWEQVPS